MMYLKEVEKLKEDSEMHVFKQNQNVPKGNAFLENQRKFLDRNKDSGITMI